MNALQFQKIILDFYKTNKRDLPWRPTKQRRVTPYEILVSEYMLQQTQVDRVVPKYNNFIKRFPTFHALIQATDKEVLQYWSGLGYNRRALYLKKAAEMILRQYDGVIPKQKEVLKIFPGMGEYMSRILPVFVYNQKEVLIETNIRTVYLYHFFKNKHEVSDKEILEMLEKTLPKKDYRDWYYALMDYGSFLKKEKKIDNKKHSGYKKQKPFKGSIRFVRGGILKRVLVGKVSKKDMYTFFPTYTVEQVNQALSGLVSEKLVKQNKQYIFI